MTDFEKLEATRAMLERMPTSDLLRFLEDAQYRAEIRNRAAAEAAAKPPALGGGTA